MNYSVVRCLDVLLALVGLVLSLPILIIVTILGYFDTGSPVFLQKRVGRYKKPFVLIKFRTMSMNTESIATHMVNTSSVTKLGGFLRKTKIDELPQLINVIKGDMSFVGPRPNLFNQTLLIKERDLRGVYKVLPGITGLAQVNEVDMSTPELLAKTDQRMIKELNLKNYFTFIIQTAIGKGSGDRIKPNY